MNPDYEVDNEEFNCLAYVVDRYGGIAWQVLGWEIVDNEDTEWTGIKQNTEKVVMVMIGDDRYFVFDLENIKGIEEDAYCSECGQIHCGHGKE